MPSTQGVEGQRRLDRGLYLWGLGVVGHPTCYGGRERLLLLAVATAA